MPRLQCHRLLSQRATFIAGSVVIARTATNADIAEQLQRHQDDGSSGVVDPATEEELREHERGVEIPDTTPEERLACEHQQTDGIVVQQY